MKFLAIDTSGKYLSVVAYNEGKTVKLFLEDCAMRHSVVLMEQIDEAFARAQMSARECDFFAVVVGPGSFTGIRIGISTIKGLCFACERPAIAVTSFECVAYDGKERAPRLLALSDAGRGELYAYGYEGTTAALGPAIIPFAQAEALVGEGWLPLSAEKIPFGCGQADPCDGLLRAVLAKSESAAPASALHAFYMRKSSAEENRK